MISTRESPSPAASTAHRKNAPTKTVEKVSTVLMSPVDALLQDFPRPTDNESAARFLRKKCKATIFMFEDHDLLRVVLKQFNAEDDCIKWQYSADIDSSDQSEWDRKFLDASQKAHDVWLSIEQDKL